MAKKKTKEMFSSKYNDELLTELIESGKSAEEMKSALGIASMQSLRQHILKWMNFHRTFVDIPGLYSRNTPTPMVNHKGELRMTRRMLTPGNFKHNDRFEIEEMTNSRIVLVRIGVEAEEVEYEITDEDQ